MSTLWQKITQTMQVKRDLNFFPLMPKFLILHQDSKNTLAIAYLYFLLSHFIIVPIVSLVPGSCTFSQLITQSLKWQPQTHLPSSWLQRSHKTHLRKGYIWRKNNYSFHLLLHIIVVSKRINTVSLLISERQSRDLWRVLEGFHIGSPPGNDFTSSLSESRIM